MIKSCRILLIFIFLVLTQSCIRSQVTSLGAEVNYLSRFIASRYFDSLKTTNDDLALVDTLFRRSLDYNSGSYSEALLGVSFTVIPHNHIPMVMPVLMLHINIPLPSSVDSVFYLKNKKLPKDLLFDSPKDDYGDKDKLAHFFGSAYLSYTSRVFDFTEIIGIFVEEFEEKFYVQSSMDPRDLFADYLGKVFGKALKKNKNILPSEVLLYYPLTFIRQTL